MTGSREMIVPLRPRRPEPVWPSEVQRTARPAAALHPPQRAIRCAQCGAQFWPRPGEKTDTCRDCREQSAAEVGQARVCRHYLLRACDLYEREQVSLFRLRSWLKEFELTAGDEVAIVDTLRQFDEALANLIGLEGAWRQSIAIVRRLGVFVRSLTPAADLPFSDTKIPRKAAEPSVERLRSLRDAN